MDPVLNPHAVLMIADDAAFPRDLVGRWQRERIVPGFTVMSTELFHGGSAGSFDLAILGPVDQRRLVSALKAVDSGLHPVICVLENAGQIQTVQAQHPRVLAVRFQEGWLDSVVLLGTECLRRVDLSRRVRRAEQAVSASARHAAVGRFMLENRHDFNNLLTSVMGNAELLKMNINSFPDLARDQIETIHATSLLMYELMQRFSSTAVGVPPASEKLSQDETDEPSQLKASGS
jgi:signal transduction histidine kinase